MNAGSRMRTNDSSRVTAAVIAIVLVTAMLLTGTFSWQAISQQSLNWATTSTYAIICVQDSGAF